MSTKKILRFVIVCFLEKKTCGDSTIPKVLTDTASLDQGRGIQRTLQNTCSINLKRNVVLSGALGCPGDTVSKKNVPSNYEFFDTYFVDNLFLQVFLARKNI